MAQTLADTLVGILQVVFSHQADTHYFRGRTAQLQEMVPGTQHRRLPHRDTHLAKNSGIEPLTLHVNRNLIDTGQVLTLDDTLQGHIAEAGHFQSYGVVQMQFRSQYEDIRLNARRLQFLHTMLSGLCLQLACCFEIRHISEMHAHGIPSQLPLHLADSFQKRCTLNITDGATYLCDDKVIFAGCLSQKADAPFDFIRDMGHYLNGLA